MKRIKKLLSMVLGVVMMLTMLSSTVSAAKTDYISAETLDWEDGDCKDVKIDMMEITNVVSTSVKPIEHPIENYNTYFKYFLVDSSTVITSLADEHKFYVDKLEYKAGKYNNIKTYKQDKEHFVADEEMEDYTYYSKGSYIKLDEPGEYLVYGLCYGNEDVGSLAYIKIAPRGTAKPIEPAVKTAVFSSMKMKINGDDVAAEAYNIDGNNYFKIRALAYLLRFSITNGTFSPKRFNVTWDEDKKAINLISNEEYKNDGGDAGFWADPHTYKATECTSAIYKDGKPIQLEAYTIKGNNYFKVRDIAKAFNIGVDWDAQTKTMCLDVNKDYVE